ncbi:putative quinol monooxygenase [Aurantimonas marina]|uniref:putative quinol monooxygenase n=1 Tax=Aurantimonas marina TaxID=2780508 RepID=UPI0019CF90CD|nr:putative quinol monooxygenase [Aurantimonas marina]
MIIVAGTQRLHPADLEALRETANATIAATRAEPGCLVYSFAQDLTEPGLVRIYEEWESRDDLTRHGKSDHIAAWRAALSKVEVLGRDLKIIEVAKSEQLA